MREIDIIGVVGTQHPTGMNKCRVLSPDNTKR